MAIGSLFIKRYLTKALKKMRGQAIWVSERRMQAEETSGKKPKGRGMYRMFYKQVGG